MPADMAPVKIQPASLNNYMEAMTRPVFQSGISWKVVEAKWPGIKEALHGFDVAVIARMGPPDIDALARDTRVIRNRRKLEAIVGNAQKMLDLERKHGSFTSYLRAHGDFTATVKALRKDFKFLGDMGCYHFLYVVGEAVPPHEEWMKKK